MKLRADLVDMAVLDAIEEHVLTPQAVEQFLLAVESRDEPARRKRLEKEVADVKRREARLVTALEGGEDLAAVRERLQELAARRKAREAELAEAQPLPRIEPELIESRLTEWRRILRGSVTQARDVVQRAIQGRLQFTTLPGGIVQFEATSRWSRLLCGFVVTAEEGPAPEHILRLAGDERGHEGEREERAELERRYEAVLQAVESKDWRPWVICSPCTHVFGIVLGRGQDS